MTEPFSLLLNFNNKVMTMCDEVEQCHKKATFWLPSANVDSVEAFCEMNSFGIIDSKEKFGALIACSLVKIR